MIKINSIEDSISEAKLRSLPFDTSFQQICLHYFSECHEAGEANALVMIAENLVKPAYHKVPAMFATQLKANTFYAHVQSYIRNGYLSVRAGNEKKRLTFRAKIVDELKRKGTYSAIKSSLPLSYRRRPSLLTSILSTLMNKKICNRCKGNKFEWFVDKSPNS